MVQIRTRIRNPATHRSVKHLPHVTPGRRKVITALGKFLMQCSLEDMLNFLHSIGVQYSISDNRKDICVEGKSYVRCRIFLQEKHGGDVQTVERYEGVHSFSAKSAVAAALSKFLATENHDFHDYKAFKPDESVREEIV